ncbi:MAG: hypothetical protein NT066_04250, partial [Candidatus Omnitrophica bacterium]|nr:hypothetical protein [Candidatus Omnitrophota bacterium]
LFLVTASAYSKESSFSVEVKVDENSLKALSLNPEKVDGAFYMMTHIVNVNDKAESFETYSCSYGQSWLSDNSAVNTGVERCRRNIPITILLQPGKSYDRSLALGFSKKAVPGSLTFKLGLSHKLGQKTKIVWSNPVTIMIDKNMLKILKPHASFGTVSIIQKDVKPSDLPFEVKKEMIKDGVQNIPLSDEERERLKKDDVDSKFHN